jgi:hypothetical protein
MMAQILLLHWKKIIQKGGPSHPRFWAWPSCISTAEPAVEVSLVCLTKCPSSGYIYSYVNSEPRSIPVTCLQIRPPLLPNPASMVEWLNVKTQFLI